MLEVGILCISFTPHCQQLQPCKNCGLESQIHKNTDTHVNMVLGETNLTGRHAVKEETSLFCCKIGQFQRLLLSNGGVLQGVKKPSESGPFNSASHQSPVVGLRKCYFTRTEDFVQITEQATADIEKKK